MDLVWLMGHKDALDQSMPYNTTNNQVQLLGSRDSKKMNEFQRGEILFLLRFPMTSWAVLS